MSDPISGYFRLSICTEFFGIGHSTTSVTFCYSPKHRTEQSFTSNLSDQSYSETLRGGPVHWVCQGKAVGPRLLGFPVRIGQHWTLGTKTGAPWVGFNALTIRPKLVGWALAKLGPLVVWFLQRNRPFRGQHFFLLGFGTIGSLYLLAIPKTPTKGSPVENLGLWIWHFSNPGKFWGTKKGLPSPVKGKFTHGLGYSINWKGYPGTKKIGRRFIISGPPHFVGILRFDQKETGGNPRWGQYLPRRCV